jgi:hypothetical protein
MSRAWRLAMALAFGAPLSVSGSARAQARDEALVDWVVKKAISASFGFCWRGSYGRGAGTMLDTCAPGHQRNGALCYPNCSAGYAGAGPVCWESCPSGFRDDGAFCAKPAPYGRGGGYGWRLGDWPFNLTQAERRCQADHGRCEQWGWIFYPACAPGFHAVGCCVCSPDCPAGMTDIGVSCAKRSYGRGAGTIPSCSSELDQNGALCYPKCAPDFHGVGPVCWGTCPESHPTNCGAGCARNAGDCAMGVLSMVWAPIDIAISIAGVALTGGTSNALFAALKNFYKANEAAIKAGLTVLKAGKSAATWSLLAAELVRIKRELQSIPPLGQLGARLGRARADAVLEAAARKFVAAALARSGLQGALEVASVVDPTGVAGAVEAYLKPLCVGDTPGVGWGQPPPSATCAPAPAGLVAWWRGEGDAADARGARGGKPSGVTFETGRVGQAFRFDGAGSYVEAPALAGALSKNQITIEAWVKADAHAKPGSCCAHIVGLDSPGQWMSHIGIDPAKPYFWTNNGIRVQDPEPLALGSWQHLAATYDGTTARFYRNGVLKASQTRSLSLPIGASTRIGGSSVDPRPFKGLVDEVSIYDRALSEAEIRGIHAAGTAGKCTPRP